MAGKSLIGALRVTLGLDSANFTAGIAKSRKEMSTMQKGAAALKGALVGMIGLETISQFRQMGRAALDNVDALGEQAVQIGVNTTALQQYRFMAGQVGISNDEMDKGLTQLTRRIGEAIAGNEKQAGAFSKLGVSLVDVNGKARDTDAVFADVAEAISKLPSAQERAAASASVFGARIGQTLLPALELGKKGILEYQAVAEKAGIIISEETIQSAGATADALKKQDDILAMQRNKMFAENAKSVASVETAWGQIQINLYKGAAGIVNFFAAWTDGAAKLQAEIDRIDAAIWATLTRWNDDSIIWANQQKQIWASMAVAVLTAKDRVIVALADWGTQAVAWVAKMVSGIKAEVVDRLNAVWKMATDKIEAVKQKFFDLYDAVVGNSYIPDMVDQIGQHMRRLGKEMVEPATAATKAAGDAFAKMQAKVGGATEVQNVRIVESFSDMTNGVLREIDRLVKGIQSGNFLDIIGGVLGAVDGIAKLFNGGAGLGGLFGSSGGTSSGKTVNSTKPPGFASGGSLRLGGLAGIDRNILSLNGSPIARVSAGETMTVSPANDRGGGGTTVIQNYYGPGADEFWGKIAAGNRQAAVQGARGGAALAARSADSIARRRLA